MNYSIAPTTQRWLLSACLILGAGGAHASCGSAFCPVNTHWDAQGFTHGEGLTLDMHYSWAKADRLRAGSSKISAEAPSGSDEELEDKRTINQMLGIDLDYAINPRWNVAFNVPLVIRDHSHTFDSSLAGPFEQQARFTQLGDIRVVGKYKLDSGNPFSGSGIRFGLKLPTGAIDRTMSPPDPADPATPYKLERSAQPGSGSTDAILGAYRFGGTPGSAWGWFASGEVQSAIRTRDHYRPGRMANVDLGINYAFSPALSGLLQLNMQHRQRDSGINANPASGGHSLNLSPGAAYAVTPNTRVYGFVQAALRQYANTDSADPASGQLTAPWSFALGVNHRF